MRLETGDGEVWAAVSQAPVEVGSSVTVTSPLLMQGFESKSLEDVIKALGGREARESGEIAIVAAQIAENGAVVPVNSVSKLPGTEAIAIAVEKNPNMLAANFEIPKGTIADVQIRIKMAQTSNVTALVRAEGKYYYAAKEIEC